MLLVCLAAGGWACGGDAPAEPRSAQAEAGAPLPTLVLVTLDTLNERHLGFFGYPHATSPNLDAWLAGSLVFEEMQTAAPWTLPSVASLLSGLPYALHGAGNRRESDHYVLTPVHAEVPLLAELLRERGYATTAIVANPYFDPRRGLGLERGFDRFYVFDGKDANEKTRARLHDTDFAAVRTAVFEGEGQAQNLVDVLEQVLGPRQRGGAFYWLHFLDAHNPYVQRDAALRGAGLEPPGTKDGTLWLDWELRRALKAGTRELGAQEREAVVRVYDGEVAYLDAQLGRLFALLEAALPGDAWTLVTTDHGEELFEHGTVDHDHTMYQELLGSFVALRGPGAGPGRDARLVRHVDVFATLCALARAGCPAPPPGARAFAGRDLLQGPPAAPPLAVSENNLTNPMLAAVRAGDAKLVVELATGRSEFYDLVEDPGERTPLRGDPREAALRAQLEALAALSPQPAEAPAAPAAAPDPALEERLRQLGYVD